MENVAGCEQDKNGDFVVTCWDGRIETVSKKGVRPVKVGPPEYDYGDIGQVKMSTDKFQNAKLKPFCAPFEDYAHRNGQNFELLRPCSPDEVSKEAGPMFWVRFSDGEEITAYPEEIFEGHEFIS